MSKNTKLLYSPALRMKAGELEGVRLLASDVAECILPRFIVPPSGERDDSTLPLLDLDRAPDISILGRYWQQRPALIDCSYIVDEFGRDRSPHWLPAMFERVRKKQVYAIPAASLNDILDCADAFRTAIDRSSAVKFGFIVPSDDMVGPEFNSAISEALGKLELAAADCVAIADFANSEFSDPIIVAEIVGGALETLQEAGLWQGVIFQGSNYPDKNPVSEIGGVEFWPRNEWRAWRRAVKLDPTTADHLIFGDYAADTALIKFGGKGGKVIPHIRYTSGDQWRVERGPSKGKRSDSIHAVYVGIATSSDFAGANFSEADAYIAHAAANPSAPHGSGKEWRQLNTTHHITQVVDDIAKVKGVEIRRSPTEAMVQMPLLLDS